MILRILLCLLLCPTAHAFSSVDDEVPIIVRGPASEKQPYRPEARARLQNVIDHKTIKAISHYNDWYIGEVLALESQTPSIGIIGFVEVLGVENKQDGTYELTCELLRQSRLHFVQIGDQLMHLDLTTENDKYKGSTDLIVQDSDKNISAKYKPLFTQGIAVGETAETLWEGEFMITWYGQVSYGWNDWLTVNTVVPADFLGAPNAAAKAQLHKSYSNVLATGLSYTKIPNESRSTLNLNIYWDSISSETVVGHTLLTLALFSFEDAEDATAIKSLGTSSLQSGYEFILGNWDRILLGPSYNFEKKAVGGYVTYLKIWDKFHFSFSINSTNITSFKLSPTDGYYAIFDAYWRF